MEWGGELDLGKFSLRHPTWKRGQMFREQVGSLEDRSELEKSVIRG